MTWERVDQVATKPKGAGASPCSVSLSTFRGGHVRLVVTLAFDVMDELGWSADQSVSLAVGRGDDAGLVQLAPIDDGKRFRAIGRSTYRTVALAVPDDMAAWEAPRLPARHQVLHQRGVGNALLVTLPWDFQPVAEEPTTEEQEAVAA
jgi:hypothetical protein